MDPLSSLQGKVEEVQSQAEEIRNATSSEVIRETSNDLPATEKSQVVGMAATNMPPLLGTSIREIQAIAKTIKTSTSELLSVIPDQSTQLAWKSFVDNILASTSKIEKLSSSLISTGAIGQFIFFPKLPIELRLMIWKLALVLGLLKLTREMFGGTEA